MKKQQTKFIIDPDFEEKVRKSFYEEYYVEVASEFVAWRNFGAIEKAETVLELCDGLKLEKVMEVGAGLCNMLLLLNKANFASEYYVLEVSPTAIQFIKDNVNIPRLKAVYLLDTNNTPFPDSFFDLGILSHVLEHAPEPQKLLCETLRICKYVVVEVPLENCLVSNIHSKFIEKTTGRKRQDNPTGHINFFNKPTIRNLIATCNAMVLKDRNYRSWKIFPKTSHVKNMISTLKAVFFYLLFKTTGSKIVTTHYGVLISSIHSINKLPQPNNCKTSPPTSLET